MADNPFEIPQTMRDMAEQNMKQAHAAYDQLTDFMTKAMGAWVGAMPANPVASGFKDVQERAVAIAKQNAELGFRCGREDDQGAEFPGDFDASDPFRTRADAVLYPPDPGVA